MKRMLLAFAMVFCVGASFALANTRPDLTGRVTHDDGAPVAKATVFIYTAGPKQGTASVCPSCYADCRKKTETGADGEFKIESLDPQLFFRLLVVAGGHESKFITKVDPGTGSQKITLERLTPEALNSKTRMAGVVMDENGNPVVGAVISPEGVERGTGTQWGGTDRFVDPVAVADEEGRFILLCKEELTSVHAIADGRNVAKRWIQLKPGRDHVVRLQEGVMVTGLIEQNGKPLGNVLVGLTTTDRICGNFFNCDSLATDKEGRFRIPNVPAGREFSLFAAMESLGDRGAAPAKVFTTGKSGSTSDIGKLEVGAGHRLVGRVILSDNKPIPSGTRLFLGRENAFDHTEALLDADGHFEFKGVPAEPVSLSVRIKGYKFSKRNPSLDWLNGGIVGTVEKDIDNLTLILDPGDWRYNGREEEDRPSGTEAQPRNQPLRAAKL